MTDLRIEITEEEILADLAWPGPPPGRWPVPEPTREPAAAPYSNGSDHLSLRLPA